MNEQPLARETVISTYFGRAGKSFENLSSCTGSAAADGTLSADVGLPLGRRDRLNGPLDHILICRSDAVDDAVAGHRLDG